MKAATGFRAASQRGERHPPYLEGRKLGQPSEGGAGTLVGGGMLSVQKVDVEPNLGGPLQSVAGGLLWGWAGVDGETNTRLLGPRGAGGGIGT